MGGIDAGRDLIAHRRIVLRAVAYFRARLGGALMSTLDVVLALLTIGLLLYLFVALLKPEIFS
jgi:K+-transporting ATPase KdpF subunit